MGEGEVRDPDGTSRRPPRRCRAGLEPVVLAEKEGLALINGTDGMLGMLVWRSPTCDRCSKTADIAAAMSVEALLGTDRVFAATCRRCARTPGQAASPPTCARCSRPTRRSSPATAARTATASRTPTRCAARRRCTAPPATPLAHAATRRRPRAGRASTTRSSCPTAGSSPTATSTARPVGYVLDFLAIAAADVADQRAPHRPDPRRRPATHGLPPFLADDPGVDSGT
jgi:histidine ammonia-lyase